MKEVGLFKTFDGKNLTNETIVVSFLPSDNVLSYTYQVYKDEMLLSTSYVFYDKCDISLPDDGKYKILVNAKFKDGSFGSLTSENYIIDREKPRINVKSSSLTVSSNVLKNVMENVRAFDNLDGEIKNISSNLSSLDLKNGKTNKLTYTVVDKAGNIATKDIDLKFSKFDYSFVVISVGVALLMLLIYFINRIYGALKLEKRIDAYVLKPIRKRNLSLSERFIKKYQVFTNKISKAFDKSVFASKYAKKLEKYLPVSDVHKTGMEIFAGKIITGLLFVIVALVAKFFSFKFIELYELIIIFTFGFFTLDILYFIKYKIFRRKIESDFSSAITIMNNAFKSGRSITQAIDTVSAELKGTVGSEFSRMSLELLYGLGIDVVFKRFAKRIDLEEANYLTASLTILNKTGGDIIKVFDSIEKSMFDKRKLRLELASLTSGSKIVIGVLLGMPFFFCLVIGLINPDYFTVFFTTDIGILLLIFMVIYYIIFVVVVRKVMKVVI